MQETKIVAHVKKPEIQTPLVSKQQTEMKKQSIQHKESAALTEAVMQGGADTTTATTNPTNDTANKMTNAEVKKLEVCEKKIATAGENYVDTGKSLDTIKTEKLYRAKFDTYEAYCEATWG